MERRPYSRVLFVDDDQWMIQPFREWLSDDGFDVRQAMDAKAARNELERSLAAGHPIDVLVLDIMMPKLSLEDLLDGGTEQLIRSADQDVWTGAEMWSELHDLYPDMEIIVYSVWPEAEIRRQFPHITGTIYRKDKDDPTNVYRGIVRALRSANTKP